MTSPARHEAEHLAVLLRREQHAMADFLLALAAFDSARRWAELGHAGLWSFLHRDLGLSGGAAFQRNVAAGLIRAFPAVERALRAGQLCLSSLVEVAKVLTTSNEAEVLPRFFRLSAREARVLVAELAPASAIPAREVVTVVAPVRSVARGLLTSGVLAGGGGNEGQQGSTGRDLTEPEPVQAGPGSAGPSRGAAPSQGGSNGAPEGGQDRRPHEGQALPDGEAPAAASRPAASRPAPTSALAPEPDSMDPLTADLRRLHLTVSRRFLEKLAAAKAIRSHAQPGASAGEILEAALDALLEKAAKRKMATASRTRARPRKSAPGSVPAAVRREVWARDGGRCQWPLEAGGTCGSTFRVELDHIRPKGRGGPPTAGNMRLLCGPHNAEAARQAYGVAFMERMVAQSRTLRRRKAQAKCTKEGAQPLPGPQEQTEGRAEGPIGVPGAMPQTGPSP